MPLLILALLAALAGPARAQFIPIPSHGISGPQFADLINEHLNGLMVIEPRLGCRPFPYLPVPTVGNLALVCKYCSATNPCSAGGATIPAFSVCISGVCQWDCDPYGP